MTLTDDQILTLQRLETSLYEKETRSSPQKVSQLLTDDFIEFGKSGELYTKQVVVDSLKEEKVTPVVSVENFVAKELAPGVVLLTYRTTINGTGSTPETHVRSSIWLQKESGWQLCFHQVTEAGSS